MGPVGSATFSFGDYQAAKPGEGAGSIGLEILGIDPNQLIKADEARLALSVTKIQTSIDKNAEKVAELAKLKDILISFQSTAAQLSTPLGSTTDAFSAKSIAQTIDNNTYKPTDLFTLETTGILENVGTSHTIKVTRLATADRIMSPANMVMPNSTEMIANVVGAFSGNLCINTVNIVLDGTETLTTIAAAINNESLLTNVTAAITKVSDTDYRLQLIALETGEAISLAGSTTALTSTDFLKESGALNLTATLTVDGVNIERKSNAINDIIQGLTVTLTQASVATVTLTVNQDTEALALAFNSLVSVYNDFLDLYNRNMVLADGVTKTDDNILYGNQFLSSAKLQIDAILFGMGVGVELINPLVAEDPPLLNYLSQIGIGFDYATSLLKIKTPETLASAITDNIKNLKSLLGIVTTNSNTDFLITSVSDYLDSTIAGEDIALTLTHNMDGSYAANYALGGVQVSAPTVNTTNMTITGLVNTVFEDFTVLYTGSTIPLGGQATTTITATQGIASLLSQTLVDMFGIQNGVENQVSCAYRSELEYFSSDNTTLQAKIDRLKESNKREIERLKKQYAAAQATAARNTMLLGKVISMQQAYYAN